MSDLLYRKALQLCLSAHAGQKDAHGVDYAVHPITVANYVDDPDGQVCALLHDIIEDTSYTADDLLEMGFPEIIVDTVVDLTRLENEKYEDYISRIEDNPLAVLVKIADLYDNLDESRGPVPGNLAKRYSVAINRLRAVHARNPYW